MPSESPVLPAQTEKPHHYMYLKEFRTQQCQLFLQHKCTQHRPFTCYHWHFMNQRRRRPVRKRDGTFNYSPDVYCTKFDETTGLCPEGDECQLLHRTAGDTERRYHLRYYKTGTCVYETDSKGHCVKNGPHCAFAHGAHHLRPPVYDIRELQTIELVPDKLSSSSTSGTPSSLEKEKFLAEDPKWNDTNYVLTNYKTEQCKRPPRLCRQGYACPQYHNTRDRRRSPKKYKYRSTPCPNVKHGDDWGDPTQCENGDNCAYCHTRTEQQFHPEIYKSTKCNDMVQTGYCPRGPFCAFAHVEHEMTSQREVTATTENSLAAFVSTVLPQTSIEDSISTDNIIGSHDQKQDETDIFNQIKFPAPIGKERSNSVSASNGNASSIGHLIDHVNNSLPEPIGKGRCNSTSSSFNSEGSFGLFSYQRAPGSEREDIQNNLRQQLSEIDNDSTIDPAEKNKRKQNLMLLHNLSISGTTQGSVSSTLSSVTSMSAMAPAFYPPSDTVAGVVGQALEELSIDDIDISSIDKDLDHDNDTNSLSSSLSAGLPAGFATSVPIVIPNTGMQRGSVGTGSLSQSPPSPFSSFSSTLLPILSKQEILLDQTGSGYLGNPNTTKLAAMCYNDVNSMSPRSGPGGPHSPFYNSHPSELQRLREEVQHNKSIQDHWEQAYTQTKCACEAWKKEAEENSRRLKSLERKLLTVRHMDEIQGGQLKQLKPDVDVIGSSQYGRQMSSRICELENVPLQQLLLLKQQLQLEISTVEKCIYQQSGTMGLKCIVCNDKKNVCPLPCNHCAMCESCGMKSSDCPYCHAHIPRPVVGTGYHL